MLSDVIQTAGTTMLYFIAILAVSMLFRLVRALLMGDICNN